MKVKEVQRTANIAWSTAKQDKILIAAGTAAQQLDASFSTNAELEIFDVNLSNGSHNLHTVAKVTVAQRFHSLVWGSQGVGGSDRPEGIVAGGMEDGSLMLWDPAKIISGGEAAMVGQATKHIGPLRCLDFNPFQTNLLASGGSNNDIFIWDINSLDKPMAPGAKPTQSQADIMGVAWNKHVSHIMASTSVDGMSVVWDLRQSRPIIRFSESSAVKSRCVAVEWSPDAATQLVTASEEDRLPVIQVWDLRNAYSPLRTLEKHTRGVLALAWCPKDADMLVTCGKDNRTLIWNPNADVPGGEVVAELPPSMNWNFDVQWCPRNPSLVATSSFAGSLSVYNVTDSGAGAGAGAGAGLADPFSGIHGGQPGQHPAMGLQRAPKWLKRPCGAVFGFGGRLAIFNAAHPGQVKVETVVTDEQLAGRAAALQGSLMGQDMAGYCAQKAGHEVDPADREMWAALHAQLVPDRRAQLVNLMGIEPPAPPPGLSVTPAPGLSTTPAPSPSVTPGLGDGEGVHGLSQRLDDLGLGTQMPNGDHDPFAGVQKGDFSHVKPAQPLPLVADRSTPEGRITAALLVADYETAVNECVEQGMWAEALLVAGMGPRELLLKTQDRFTAAHDMDVHRLLAVVARRDWLALVNDAVLANWRETLALLCTYAPDDAFPALSEQLGDRLRTEQAGTLKGHALVCYVCAGAQDKVVDVWTELRHGEPSLDSLLRLIELISVLGAVTGKPHSGDATEAAFARYAQLLASQGLLDIALGYLDMCSASVGQLAVMRDRVFHARTSQRPGEMAPAFPFEVEPVLSQAEIQNARLREQQQLQQRHPYGMPGQASAYGAPQYATQHSYGYGQPGPALGQPTSFAPAPMHPMQQQQPYAAQPPFQPMPPPPLNNPYSQPQMGPPLGTPPQPPMPGMGIGALYGQMPSMAPPPATPLDPPPAPAPLFQAAQPPPLSSQPTHAPMPVHRVASTPQPPQNFFVPQPQVPGAMPHMAAQAAPAPAPPAPKSKPPMPEQHKPLVAAIDQAIERGSQIGNPTAKKKFGDLKHRMEQFYDTLRENKVDPAIMEHLYAMGTALNARNYDQCHQIYNYLVTQFATDSISAGLVGLKTLYQLLRQYNC